jgi:hypothetical protein
MASYALLDSYTTRQVLSPQVVNDVEYCTIQTSPSGVIAGIPVQKNVFDANQAGPELTNFADAIEQTMTLPGVTAGTGVQSIDQNGLLQDKVAFTVEYVPPGNTPTSITAEALVPVTMLNFTDAEIGQAALADVEKIISKTYANLQNAAGF